ncbi:hypothetical protein PSPO01_15243 [Paraphaeosphaeria sporulosa]
MADQQLPTASWPSIAVGSRPDERVEDGVARRYHDANAAEPVGLGIQLSQQNDQYLRLSQLFECEIWLHSETRTALHSELFRRQELEEQLHHYTLNIRQLEVQLEQQSYTVSQWQQTCSTLYEVLGNQSKENAQLGLEKEELAAELAHLKAIHGSQVPAMATPHSDISRPDVQRESLDCVGSCDVLCGSNRDEQWAATSTTEDIVNYQDDMKN